MGFETKRALLEYLGKNPNDNKLVDRLILRGEVEIRDGLYYVVDKDGEIKELKEKIIFLENQQGKNTLDELTKQYEEAKAQWEYYENAYNEEVEDKQNRIRKCFQWIKQKVRWANWEEFRDWVLSDEE